MKSRGAQQASAGEGFAPDQVPQIAAGEYWLPAIGVSGSSPVLWVGRNGTNTLSTAGAGAPDPVTGPGGNPAWTYVAADSDSYEIAAPAAPLTATDGVYVAFWFRYDGLDSTNRVLVEQNGSAGARKWHIRKTASTSVIQVEWSDDGTNQLISNVALTEDERLGTVSILDKYLFCEVFIDPTGVGLPSKTRIWFDGIEKTWDNQSGTGGAALFDGGIFRVGNNNFQNQDFGGQFGPLYIGVRSGGILLPTDAHRARLMRHRAPKATHLNVVLDGNSIMAGEDSSDPATTGPVGVLRSSLVALSYPSRDVHDRGLGGATTQDMINGYAARVAPFYDRVFARNILVFFEVRNSTVAGQTAAQIFAQYQSYAALGRATGFHVIACTAPPTDGAAVGQGEAGGANTLIRANWQSFADGFVDLELVPEFTPAGNIANPTYYVTGVHLTDAGCAILAARFLTAVRS